MTMESTITDDASADDAAILNGLRATLAQSAAPLARREARERRKAAPKIKAPRAPRKGHDRTAQLNIKMRPDIKERLAAYCERQGIAVTDWLEEIVTSLGGN